MPVYRIFRLRPHLKQSFRNAPHVGGLCGVKPRDYQESGVVEAPSHYAAWFQMRSGDAPLEVGDILDSEAGLCIVKYVGFEAAQWVQPESKPEEEPAAAAVSAER